MKKIIYTVIMLGVAFDTFAMQDPVSVRSEESETAMCFVQEEQHPVGLQNLQRQVDNAMQERLLQLEEERRRIADSRQDLRANWLEDLCELVALFAIGYFIVIPVLDAWRRDVSDLQVFEDWFARRLGLQPR